MAAAARTVRSGAASTSSRPATKTQSRPELRVITGDRASKNVKDTQSEAFSRLSTWARTRTAPLTRVVIAVVFLAASLFGTLLLRTEMVQNSFAASELQQSVNSLTQDVEEDQAKLNELVASLPSKAKDMGMSAPTQTVNIDVSGYKPSEGGAQ